MTNKLLNIALKSNLIKRYPSLLTNRIQKTYFSTSNQNQNENKNKTQMCCKQEEKVLASVELGQPTYWTHPHLFQQNEFSQPSQQVTPGITKKEFEQRRNQYIQYLINYQTVYFSTDIKRSFQMDYTKMITNNIKNKVDYNFISIIPSSMDSFMSPDVPYTFKQNSDFLYLTGFKETGSVLVLSRTDNDNNDIYSYKASLFVREKTPKVELWEGSLTGPELVPKLTGINNAYPITELKHYLESLMKETNSNRKVTLWRYPVEAVKLESGPNCVNPKVEEVLDEFIIENDGNNKLIVMNEQENIDERSTSSYFNSSRYFAQLCRVKKSIAEQSLLKRACDITSEAIKNTMFISHPFINESLLYTKFEYDCRIRGSEFISYIPVVGGGNRATSLHYIKNNQLVQPDSLILMDAGCYFNDYSSDITRTWPVNGKFTAPQRDLYEACLNVQMYCLEFCKPGVTLAFLYSKMIYKLAQQFTLLGLLDKTDFETIDSKNLNHFPMEILSKVNKYCPHDIGHYLGELFKFNLKRLFIFLLIYIFIYEGLDVHDCPEISKRLQLEPGAVITIEPGIYIPINDKMAHPKYRGIGIRIEDDVVITDDGHRVLSKKIPKTIDEIENILKKN
jgi:Xaa-Pro aminopeptidase